MKFARRESRRGNTYDGIILDPPAYGHGPDGEKWKLDECLFEMLKTVAAILAPGGFVVLNLYSNGYSAALGETLVRQSFGQATLSEPVSTMDTEARRADRGVQGEPSPGARGCPSFKIAEAKPLGVLGDSSRSADVLTSGELALRDSFGKVLPLSIVVRLEISK